jgi:hypothetical protein
MRRQSPSSREEDEAAMRVGGTAIGLLAGLAIGSIAAGLLVAAGAEFSAGWAFFLCIAAGAVTGYASSAAGLGLAEGVAHFIVGAIHGVAEQIQSPSNRVPWWLRWLFVAGVLSGLAILITARW